MSDLLQNQRRALPPVRVPTMTERPSKTDAQERALPSADFLRLFNSRCHNAQTFLYFRRQKSSAGKQQDELNFRAL